MVSVRTNKTKVDSSAPAALIEIVRLLARQAAREWAVSEPEADRAPATSLAPPERQR